jgi:Domain of unknown function (DUF4396)
MNLHSSHRGHSHAQPLNRHTTVPNLNRVAAWATLHCLTGCAVGEVLGMVIGTSLHLSNAGTIALAVTLAFAFGYAFTMFPLVRSGMPLRTAAGLALASDTLSIAIMEVVDNGIMLAWPGAMDADLASPVFWIALASSLAIAAVAAYPANRWLISRGRGHALVHSHHGH